MAKLYTRDSIYSFGLNASHMAAMRGQPFLLNQMQEQGAALDAPDNKGRRPLEVAEENRQETVVKYLKNTMYHSKIKVT